MSDMEGAAPLISIVTSTLNAAEVLPYTVKSLGAQRGASFEWIVIDGGSRDGTLDLLRAAGPLIAHWVSKPDGGIYDAWNKGCALARGQWLLFMGAGDELAAPDTLASLAQVLRDAHPAYDLVYGRLLYISAVERVSLEEVGEPWAQLEGRWELCRPALPPHPAVFHHRALFKGARPFDTRFRLAGDSHFLLRHALRKAPLFVPIAVCRCPIGGVTLNLGSAAALAREIRDMNRELGLAPPLGHRLAENALLAAKVAAAGLPAPLGRRIADLYRRVTGRPARWTIR